MYVFQNSDIGNTYGIILGSNLFIYIKQFLKLNKKLKFSIENTTLII